MKLAIVRLVLFVTVAFSLSLAMAQEGQSTGRLESHRAPGSFILSVTGVASDQIRDVRQGRENRQVQFGGGLLAEANINSHFGIETGFLVIDRQYDFERQNVRLVEHASRLHVPILARIWFTDFLSIGAGPFVAFKLGGVREATRQGGVTEGIRTAANQNVEVGLDAAATLNLALNRKTGVFLEGRYSFLAENRSNEDNNILMALLGVKIDL